MVVSSRTSAGAESNTGSAISNGGREGSRSTGAAFTAAIRAENAGHVTCASIPSLARATAAAISREAAARTSDEAASGRESSDDSWAFGNISNTARMGIFASAASSSVVSASANADSSCPESAGSYGVRALTAPAMTILQVRSARCAAPSSIARASESAPASTTKLGPDRSKKLATRPAATFAIWPGNV